ncbi:MULTISPECIES: hypothetical protein [unclassified Microcoleus]|uniref:hypothetical protein n=1 Tax=unclassified Microcoleus TaxID=2642155 RepID=UPI002FD26A13
MFLRFVWENAWCALDARAVRNRVFCENAGLQGVDWVKNPVSWLFLGGIGGFGLGLEFVAGDRPSCFARLGLGGVFGLGDRFFQFLMYFHHHLKPSDS